MVLGFTRSPKPKKTEALNPKPQALNPKPDLNLNLQTLNPKLGFKGFGFGVWGQLGCLGIGLWVALLLLGLRLSVWVDWVFRSIGFGDLGMLELRV